MLCRSFRLEHLWYHIDGISLRERLLILSFIDVAIFSAIRFLTELRGEDSALSHMAGLRKVNALLFVFGTLGRVRTGLILGVEKVLKYHGPKIDLLTVW